MAPKLDTDGRITEGQFTGLTLDDLEHNRDRLREAVAELHLVRGMQMETASPILQVRAMLASLDQALASRDLDRMAAENRS